MKKNEGMLGKHTIGGEDIYTKDHPPVILTGKLKEGHGAIKAGTVLVIDTNGALDVIASPNTLQIGGISTEDIPAGDSQKYVDYLAHGTVKSESLIGASGAAFTDYAKLKAAGIYPL